MAHESFEDQEVAELINTHFVSIKVDREERPDVDSVYMTVCQAFTGSGGWPLTVIMTPDQKPFFAGTYYPKQSKYGRPGLMDLLKGVANKWETNKEKLVASSDEIMEALEDQFSVLSKPGDLTKSTIKRAVTLFHNQFDVTYGGFGQAPKFPTPHHLMFLLRYYHLEKDQKVLQMVEKTLQQMYKGGIFDHIGFGFSRYSTDRMWLAPHFEKMLYDNALLTMTYLEAYQVTKNELYKKVAVRTMAYVLRELTDDEGGFYSAQDADSEGEEGKYYVFKPNEIIEVLGEEDGQYFNQYFKIMPSGNFEGKNIPNLISNEDFDMPNERIDRLTKKVLRYRIERTYLHKDDKILTSWNALMIVSFAKAYKILENERYLSAAIKAICFIEDKLINDNERILARYREGEASYLGYLEDYSFFVWALIEMYEATFDIDYLKKALKYNKEMIEYFWDDKKGGFFLYGNDGEQLIARPKELYDGAMPSGNSVAAYNLLKLARLTGEKELEELADRQLKFYISSTKEYPIGYSFYMMALLFALYPSGEIICVLKDCDDLNHLKSLVSEKFIPNKSILVKTTENEKEINSIIKTLKDYSLKDDQATYYVCENQACSSPFNDINELKRRL
jgi:uncharacterized protein YyaL (SSP411 family)